VIRNDCSYGGKDGLYEMAILHRGQITYTSPIFTDVKGWLSPDEISQFLLEIELLPKSEKEKT